MTNFITSALKPLTGLHVPASLSLDYPADFCFSVHKLHRKHSIFHGLHTFQNETSALHNSSSWLTWLLHMSLSNMIEHVHLSRAHISRFAQTSLVTTYGMCRAIQTTHTYPSRTFHYRTYLHATNSSCHLVTSFLLHPCDVTITCACHDSHHVTSILSRGQTLADNLSSFTSK